MKGLAKEKDWKRNQKKKIDEIRKEMYFYRIEFR